MTTSLTLLATELRNRFPKLDIRSDQSESIRLISPTIAAQCKVVDGDFQATLVSLDASELDYEDELIAEFCEPEAELLINRLAEYFTTEEV
jgi:hypothetical protein